MMRFKDYFKQRRTQLGLNQGDFPGFDRSYISKIERGRNNPLKPEKVKELAKTLQLPDNMADWLLTYSFLDRDPYECIPPQGGQYRNAHRHFTTHEHTAGYQSHIPPKMYGGKIQIRPGMLADDVLRQLGEPETDIDVGGPEVKWIYKEEGLAITLEGGVVKQASFI